MRSNLQSIFAGLVGFTFGSLFMYFLYDFNLLYYCLAGIGLTLMIIFDIIIKTKELNKGKQK